MHPGTNACRTISPMCAACWALAWRSSSRPGGGRLPALARSRAAWPESPSLFPTAGEDCLLLATVHLLALGLGLESKGRHTLGAGPLLPCRRLLRGGTRQRALAA